MDALEIWTGAPLRNKRWRIDPLAVWLHRKHAHPEVGSIHARGAVCHTHLNYHGAPWLRMAGNEHMPKLIDACEIAAEVPEQRQNRRSLCRRRQCNGRYVGTLRKVAID